ncbi:MAG: zinc-ribbon domain-containing protein [Ilumatobacter fluminis]|uniref:zinc ribbon domain-containing protein n=1 Tax=Ilumatobacter fluminis TaxID=467091 RepID=UPI0032ED7F7F
MQCHECGNSVAPDDRFCTACGASLADQQAAEPTDDDPAAVDAVDASASTDAPSVEAGDDSDELAPTEQVDTVPIAVVETAEPDDVWGDDDPVWAATGSVDTIGQPIADTPSTDQLPATEPITEVWTRPGSATPIVTAEEVAGDDPWTNEPGITRTTAMTTAPGTAQMPVLPTPIREKARFRFTAVLAFSVVGGIVTLLSLFATIVSVTSNERLVRTPETPAAFRTGDWISTDLADNMPIAGLIAVCLLVAGGVASAFGWRGGSGLAGGAGLAIAGIAALTVGLAQIPIDAAYEMAAIPSEQQFTLTITRDLGYWLLVAAGAIGVVVFFASLNDAFGDHRSGLNPWIAAVGALSGLVMAGGPLIPEGLASFSDNWYVSDAPGSPPAMLLTTRLVQLGLLALAALIGFLSVRRWGLGVAVGGGMPSIWLTVSTLFELGENPAGPGYNNPGASSMGVHGVTIIGASALLAFALLAVVAAYDQASRGY